MQKKKQTEKTRIILLGIDGATWDIIDPLFKMGKMPNLKSIVDHGVRANNRSLEVPASPRVWTSIATGKTENKHGIMDFFSTTRQLKASRIWDILQKHGQSVSVFYWFLTWPPQKNINGFMVPGMLARDSRTMPQSLFFLKELEISEKIKIQESQKIGGRFRYLELGFNALKNGVRLSTLVKAAFYLLGRKVRKYSELDEFPKLQYLKLYLYSDVFNYLIKKHPTDFSCIIFPQTDQICHKYWSFMEPDQFEERTGIHISKEDRQKYGHVIYETYQKIDRELGRVIRSLRNDDILMVVSDHGFGMVEEMYAQLKIKSEVFLKQMGIEKIAHGVSIGGYYVLQVNEKVPYSQQDEIIQKLKQIVFEENNEPIFKVKSEGREIILEMRKIFNLNIHKGAEILDRKILLNSTTLRARDILVNRFDISGEHMPIGIFAMMGKHIQKNVRLDEISVLDITPTILYLKGLPIAEDMDGQPVLQAIEDAYVQKNPVEYIPTFESENLSPAGDVGDETEMSDALKERLKALGYIN